MLKNKPKMATEMNQNDVRTLTHHYQIPIFLELGVHGRHVATEKKDGKEHLDAYRIGSSTADGF